MKTKLLFFLVILLIPIIINAQTVCFSEEDSKRIVMELEKGKLLEKNIQLLEKQTEQLIKQTEILKEQVNLSQEKFKASQELIEKNETLYKLEKEALENELTQAKKPRWGSLFSSFGLGSITVMALLLFL